MTDSGDPRLHPGETFCQSCKQWHADGEFGARYIKSGGAEVPFRTCLSCRTKGKLHAQQYDRIDPDIDKFTHQRVGKARYCQVCFIQMRYSTDGEHPDVPRDGIPVCYACRERYSDWRARMADTVEVAV